MLSSFDDATLKDVANKAIKSLCHDLNVEAIRCCMDLGCDIDFMHMTYVIKSLRPQTISKTLEILRMMVNFGVPFRKYAIYSDSTSGFMNGSGGAGSGATSKNDSAINRYFSDEVRCGKNMFTETINAVLNTSFTEVTQELKDLLTWELTLVSINESVELIQIFFIALYSYPGHNVFLIRELIRFLLYNGFDTSAVSLNQTLASVLKKTCIPLYHEYLQMVDNIELR